MSILTPSGRRERRRAAQAGSPSRVDAVVRNRLAQWVVVLGFLVVAALAVAIIFLASDKYQSAQLALTSVLPLFGTWVGMVLAFYFGKGNLEAATESTLQLTGRVSRDTAVVQVMIPRASIVARILKADEDPTKVTVESLHSLMGTDGKRVPIFDKDDIVRWIVHESLLLAFATKQGKPLSDQAIQSMTLANILEAAEFATQARAMAFVPVGGTIANARERLQAVSGCNDVFVTATGKATEPVLGWLTNTLLAAAD